MGKMLLLFALVFQVTGFALPPQAEMAKVRPFIEELMAEDWAALKKGTKSAGDVGDVAVRYAKEAETEVARYILLREALTLYVRGRAYDKAVETLGTMKDALPDLMVDDQLAIVADVLREAKVQAPDVPQLLAVQRQLQAQKKLLIAARATIRSVQIKLHERPNDLLLRRSLAEWSAVVGDWPQAREAFDMLGGQESAIVELEAERRELFTAAEFWWGYKPSVATATEAFRLHARVLYRQLLVNGKLTDVQKSLVERRIKESVPILSRTGVGTNPAVVGTKPINVKLYMCIDISAGATVKRYPVTYLDDVPENGWTDEYKTKKIVLRRIEPGSFIFGDQVHGGKAAMFGLDDYSAYHTAKVTLTKPFYIGVFEVTRSQWMLIKGDSSQNGDSNAGNDTHPVCKVSYADVRGNDLGARWPKGKSIDRASFLNLLRLRTSLKFDLPTEVQWEYACRAGTQTDFPNGKNCSRDNHGFDAAANEVGQYQHWNNVRTLAVGSFKPNDWGLYDMNGNVFEMCCDWYGTEYAREMTDSFGPLVGKFRIAKGGSWESRPILISSSSRMTISSDGRSQSLGLRLMCPVK